MFPDGCQDVLIVEPPRGPVRILLTSIDYRPCHADLAAGVQLRGYRLRPGATMSTAALAAIARAPAHVESILADACGEWSDLDDAIQTLAEPGMTVEVAARRSPRTMQRQFKARHLPPPDFRRLLSRARCAAAMLASSGPLAMIAGECGFADQAHMTRDIRRWFGATPAQLCRSRHVLDLLRQSALGNWTGEHISTR